LHQTFNNFINFLKIELFLKTLQKQLVEVTYEWGVQVERVAIKNVRLPQQLQRAMAAEAEASREARAKLLDAEGEQKASRALAEAADIMAENSFAIQLRYLQTLQTIASEKNETIVFPIPIDFLNALFKKDV
jgi:erythrocyte band 7 integral membrane protein